MKILEANSSILNKLFYTVGVSRELLIEFRDFFELFLNDLNYAIQHVWFYLFDFLAIDLTDNLVNFLEGLPELGIEMIFDAIIGPKCDFVYLDSSREPMIAHLLPSSLCNSNSLC